mmetsp:Transcript_14277/g.20099  ORF Transcript_14277/g.20099 Transcript_14277/m.20099 type:complete len:241 (+) Transcript_14277:518-1240(+)
MRMQIVTAVVMTMMMMTLILQLHRHPLPMLVVVLLNCHRQKLMMVLIQIRQIRRILLIARRKISMTRMTTMKLKMSMNKMVIYQLVVKKRKKRMRMGIMICRIIKQRLQIAKAWKKKMRMRLMKMKITLQGRTWNLKKVMKTKVVVVVLLMMKTSRTMLAVGKSKLIKIFLYQKKRVIQLVLQRLVRLFQTMAVDHLFQWMKLKICWKNHLPTKMILVKNRPMKKNRKSQDLIRSQKQSW